MTVLHYTQCVGLLDDV